MRTILVSLLLLAAFGPGRGAWAADDAPGAQPPARADAPPARREDPAQPWTPEQRALVRQQCELAFPGENICACVTHQIELLSPDPEVVTAEAIQTGVKRCRRV